ncbi:hypothetical protein M9458_018419 [Cirrhinus mrigala]|uniref:Uncharacterized protein n=1 Tax=Cirrhinus mrigala TaxID=683832 RepID=A0ABD0QKT1_CIRMR
MDDLAVLILLLEQEDRTLEDHTTDFVFFSQPDTLPGQLPLLVLSSWTELRHTSAAVRGPRESLAAFVEWVLVSYQSSLTVDFADDDTSPTPDPEPSQPSPRFTEHEPEPTADREPEPSTTDEPSPNGATMLPITSDQV